jgi:hypothetical protein
VIDFSPADVFLQISCETKLFAPLRSRQKIVLKRLSFYLREQTGQILVDQFVLDNQQLLIKLVIRQKLLFNKRRIFRR